ncbi:MAG: biotin/lipoyl-binding protein, partial [Spirochaetota bacterium]|nr:biotin/lipoyl-binding protein [Spirochaetota bacterium]
NSDKKIEIIRNATSSSVTSQPAKKKEEPITYSVQENKKETPQDTTDITSPYIGFFHRSNSKGGKPLVKLREVVDDQKVVAYIRSMNLQYEVLAGQSGKIIEVLVEDGQAVEYGQPLFRLKSQDDTDE